MFASHLIRRSLLNVRQGRCTGVMRFFPTQNMWQQAQFFNGRVEKVLTRYPRVQLQHCFPSGPLSFDSALFYTEIED